MIWFSTFFLKYITELWLGVVFAGKLWTGSFLRCFILFFYLYHISRDSKIGTKKNSKLSYNLKWCSTMLTNTSEFSFNISLIIILVFTSLCKLSYSCLYRVRKGLEKVSCFLLYWIKYSIVFYCILLKCPKVGFDCHCIFHIGQFLQCCSKEYQLLCLLFWSN